MDGNIDVFKEGIFSLNTRRFGTLAEIMIKKLYGYHWSGTTSFDLFDAENDGRIEVKFSRAAQAHLERINENNVVEQCLISAFLENRSLNSTDTGIFDFDSNIQQIKCRNFDFLFYGLFFMDCIEIFGIESNLIYEIPGYSDHQHAGNQGEGQFHINNSNILYHRQNNYIKSLSYPELYDLLIQE